MKSLVMVTFNWLKLEFLDWAPGLRWTLNCGASHLHRQPQLQIRHAFFLTTFQYPRCSTAF